MTVLRRTDKLVALNCPILRSFLGRKENVPVPENPSRRNIAPLGRCSYKIRFPGEQISYEYSPLLRISPSFLLRFIAWDE